MSGVVEIAEIDVVPDTESAFERAVAAAAPHFKAASGCRSFELMKSSEVPTRYRLMVGWDEIEDHTVRFRASEGFTAWRGLVLEYFATPPRVEHVTSVLHSF